MVSNKNIAAYYDQTLNHYQTWWKLDDAMAVHYGLRDETTKKFSDELLNTNRIMAEMIHLKAGERILDAGCGVGGSLFYLTKKYKIRGSGLTLSEKQFRYAQKRAKELHLDQYVQFKKQDFCHTDFADESFDVVWALESLSHLPNKQDFAKEAFRLLKPGGRLIIACYNRTLKPDKRGLIKKWQTTWSLDSIVSTTSYIELMEKAGFVVLKTEDLTKAAYPTAKRMYLASLIGMLPSLIYNATHQTSHFARRHFMSGIYQYKALKKGLWKYIIISLEKPK